MPIPQEKITLVGWAEEPVPSIDQDFCKRSIVTSSEGDGVGPSPLLREISSSKPVNFTRSHTQDKPWPKSLQ